MAKQVLKTYQDCEDFVRGCCLLWGGRRRRPCLKG